MFTFKQFHEIASMAITRNSHIIMLVDTHFVWCFQRVVASSLLVSINRVLDLPKQLLWLVTFLSYIKYNTRNYKETKGRANKVEKYILEWMKNMQIDNEVQKKSQKTIDKTL